MIRHDITFSLTAAVLMAVLVSTTLGDVRNSLWCSPVLTERYVNCLNRKMKSDPNLLITPDEREDFTKSMLDAQLRAIEESSDSVKLMKGALTYALLDLMDPRSEEETLHVLKMVGDCHATTTGQPQYSLNFTESIAKENQFCTTLVSSTEFDIYVPPLQPYITLPRSEQCAPLSPKLSPFYPNAGLLNSAQLSSGQCKTNVDSLIYPPNKQDNAPYVRPRPSV